jgi:hypothetical protein
MSRQNQMLIIAAALSLIIAVSVNVAFADSAPATQAPIASAVPLPQNRSDAQSANPASPNCYPDINHCASYPSGDVSKANPIQPQQVPVQQGKGAQ